MPVRFTAVFLQIAASLRGWRRLAVDDLVTFVQFASEAFLWRGAWNLNARFLIPDPCVGGWVNLALGTALLMSLQLFSYVGGCGTAVDGLDADDDVSSGQLVVCV